MNILSVTIICDLKIDQFVTQNSKGHKSLLNKFDMQMVQW